MTPWSIATCHDDASILLRQLVRFWQSAYAMPMPEDRSNREQIDYWNGDAARRWIAARGQLYPLLAPITRRLLAAVGIAVGERVIDLGCGCGEVSFEAGRLTGSTGAVLGVDVSAPMIEAARAERDPALRQVVFERADASTYEFERHAANVVLSRFGVMFFEDPGMAFANMRKALRPGGRLVFVCWQPLRENAWMATPMPAVLEHVPAPQPPAAGAPGPFSLADPGRIEAILRGAGYDSVAIEPVRVPVSVKGSVDAVLSFYTSVGPMARLLRDAEPRARKRAIAALRRVLAAHHDGEAASFGSASWLVSARA